MTKRTITLLLAGAILLSFVGCDSETETPPKDTSESGTSVMVTEETEPLDETSAEINDETDPMTEVVTDPLPEETDAPVILPPETKPSETMPPETEAPKESEEDMIKECKLIVRGKEIETKNSAYMNLKEKYYVLPFTEVFEAIGGEIEWNTETEATLSYDNKRFLLNLENQTLVHESDSFNAFVYPCGGTDIINRTKQAVNKELMLGDYYMYYFFQGHFNIIIEADYDNLTISIDDNPYYLKKN